MADIAPFKIHLPDSLLEEVKIKLKYARLDDGMADVEWNDLEIGHSSFRELVEYWRDEPGSFLEVTKILPLLIEPADGKQAFHVVAPSLPGYGFSQYSKKSGFGLEQHAACFAKLMTKLGYGQYVCQGGDWGSTIVRYMALNHPDAVQAIHINMFLALPPDEKKSPEKFARYQKNDYSERELKNLKRPTGLRTTREVTNVSRKQSRQH
ncbi:hypothetical protein NW768_002879 [Fusarium equiseti]|uniref:AB hydrolase-1 domain-containing protein n=1 Tax=Fusarium equiseti TaxID=61235 RepID=A0ABQ8RKD7_FUSEQ|nr:hypothetical protein NW768_002879 [Fusarium equiseti]